MSVEQDYKGAAARLRARLGPVGVWMLLLSEPATAERAAARRLEDLG